MEDIEERDGGEIIADVVEDAGDFRYGHTVWTMTPAGDGTLVRLESTMEPGFWIPPLIGPAIVKRKMRREAEETIFTIERLVVNADEQPE